MLEAKVIGISLPTSLTWARSCCEWVRLVHALSGIWIGIMLRVLVRNRVLWLNDHTCSERVVSHSAHELLVCVEIVILVLEVLVHCCAHVLHHRIHHLVRLELLLWIRHELLLLVLEAHLLLHHGVLLGKLCILVVVTSD